MKLHRMKQYMSCGTQQVPFPGLLMTSLGHYTCQTALVSAFRISLHHPLKQ